MKLPFPFLQKIAALGGPAVGQVTGHGVPAAALHYLLAELPELLLTAVYAVESSELLASYTAERTYSAAAVTAPITAAVRQVQAGLVVQGQPASELREVLLTLGSQLHLLGLAPDGRHVLYLAVAAHDTNLALARQLVQQAAQQLLNI